MIEEDHSVLIAFLVEKTMKGVRKQMNGFVKDITDAVNNSVQRVKYLSSEFESDVDRAEKIRADFHALELIIDEGKINRKLFVDMEIMLSQANNRLTDLNFLRIENENQLKLMKSESKAIKNQMIALENALHKKG